MKQITTQLSQSRFTTRSRQDIPEINITNKVMEKQSRNKHSKAFKVYKKRKKGREEDKEEISLYNFIFWFTFFLPYLENMPLPL